MSTKERLWKLIENYRMSGGREEHWRNRDLLDIELDHLITAKSDLLEALKFIIRGVPDTWDGVIKARAAIAKAGGAA